MTTNREIKDVLYSQVATIGKALASPKRLELIELLAQDEKNVELLAREAAIDVKLASAHLKVLRQSRLVAMRREGKSVFYRLTNARVADLWVNLHQAAEEYLAEMRAAVLEMVEHPDELTSTDALEILRRAKRGEVVVIDVRPREEFEYAHLPCARSLPITELQQRLQELPKGKPIVAYCRGPFCLFAKQATELLRREGFDATRLTDGIAEWRARGLPLKNRAA